MSKFAKVSFILFSSISALTLSACQSLQTQPQSTQPTTQGLNQFNLQGKIGGKTPQQSGSAFFTWQQNQEQFDIELSGILGVGKTQITGQPGQVSLNSAKTGRITAASPEELLEQATGWRTPITNLVHWVQAKPASLKAELQKDQQQRIQQIIEDGWTVNLSYNQAATLPNKLILQQQLETGQANRITMIIQNR